ncbi:protease modulator HflC [Saccharobesus litoralis]|uniref:Protein HflC n=1 Tax=Saccharobesus litoralis TaxID=2172099 RepID=A0A2S0VWA9_9ALTE|nr:protease modulator HflC [Saccharobesus litoralis]AWB68507.1 protease modulator HflC [Saccharobesus litoralis]
MRNLSLVLIAIFAFFVYTSVFVINEGTRGIVIQFGKVKRDVDNSTVVHEPGIHFKWPFIETVRILDARVQTMDDEADRFVTSEKKDLIVDSYVKWRIESFETFYLKTGGDTMRAEALLKKKINNGLRSEFGSRTIAEIVSGERDELMQEALKETAESAADLGIQIVDIRVKRINLPSEVSNYIFARMRSERHAVAKEHRSEGREKAEFIKADIDKKVTIMLADAERNVRTVRGQGDAEAAKIYADTYNKDPEFYKFLRSLDAYRASFNNKGDVLIVKPDSDFFKYLKETGK